MQQLVMFSQNTLMNITKFVVDAFREALRLFDNIGILVNCAGFLNEFYWQKEMQVNLVCKCLKGYNPQKKFKTDRFAGRYKYLVPLCYKRLLFLNRPQIQLT